MASHVSKSSESSLVKGVSDKRTNLTTPARTREGEIALLRTVRDREFKDELRRLRTRQGRFDSGMLHFGHVAASGGSRLLEASDGGAGAERIYAALDGPSLWQKLWKRDRAALRARHRGVLDALLVDRRPRVAARMAGVGKNLVYACWNDVFPARFEDAYRALVNGRI